MSDKHNSMLDHHGQLKSTPEQPLLDGIPAPIFYKDAEGVYRACNTAFAELVLGLPKERIIGSSVYDLPEAIPPELADVYHERDMELIHNPGSQVYEAQVKYTDGLLHNVVFNKSTLVDAEGKVTGMAGVMLDVTERKQLEERERYTSKLRIAAEIAESIGVVSDINTILEVVVTQIRRAFDFYHVHIYLLDETQKYLVIQYGSGETGLKLLEEKHTIPISFENSLVARAARTRDSVTASDTSQEVNYLSHPLFPHTRSELTLPLITQGELLGVLDIQDDEIGRFTQADVDILTTLTGQIASALRNARLFDVQARAEQAARESESESTALLNAVPDMMFRFDKEGNFLDYKAEAGATLITPPGAFLGKHITEVLPPELARITLRHLQQTLDTGEIVVYEYQTPVGDELRFYEARMTTVGTQEVLSLIRDITDRKEAEVERQRFNLLLGTASEIATQVTAILDPDELLSTVIKLLKERFDLYYAHVYTLDDEKQRLVLRAGYGEPGRVMLSQGHNIPLDKEQSLVARAARTHQVVLVGDVKDNPDFLPNPLLPHTKTEAAVPLIVGDHVLGVFDIQHDESHYFTQAYIDVFNALAGQIATSLENAYLFEEQHKVRMAIQQSQQRFQDLVENLNDWIWELDTNGAYTYVSPKVTEILGYQPEELLGKTPSDLMPPDEAQRVAPILSKLTVSQEPIVAIENVNVHKNGHLVIFETSGTPYYDVDGNYLGYRGTDRDITERKQREAQIIESEERYRLVTQMTEQLIYDFDIVSGEIRWAGAIEALTGYTSEEFAQIGIDKWSEFIHPEDRDRALALLDEATEKAVPYNVEYRFRRKDGTYFHVEDHGDFLVDEDGHAYRMLGIQADITERKQTEAQIRKSEERFRRIAETMHGGLAIVENREIVYISDRLVDILGYSKEELKHMSGFDYADPEEHGRLNAFVAATQAGTVPDELAFWIIRKDGQRRYIRNSYSVLEVDGQIIGRFVITTDETERELAQHSLAESEERLSLALEAANTASWEFRPFEDYVYFGPRWYTMLGYKPNELPQAFETWSSLLHPDDLTWVDPIIQEHIQEGKDYALDFRMRTKDGNWRWIHAIGKVTERNESGAATRLVGTHTDITERRLAEQERDRQARIIQSSTDFISMANADGRGVYINAAGLDMLGYTEEEYQQGKFFISEVQPDMPDGAVETAFRDGVWEGESSLVTKDGRVIPVSQTLFTMTVGTEIMLATIARDITAQKQAEAAIQENERRLATLMGNLPGMAYRMLNQSGWPAEFISEGGLELTGYKPQELIVGKSHKLNYGDLIHPDDQDWVWAGVQASLEKQEPYELTYRIHDAAGELRWVWERGQGVFDSEGDLLSLEGFVTDVTASQQAKAERARFTTRLNTAAQISEQVGSILDPDELLQTVIPLIKEQFGLYYVHVYILDEESGMLNLRAGYGKAGEQMLAEGHSIPLDREASLVATAARTREPVLVDDVTENPNFMPNPLLPDTKTEVAVPSIAGGKVLGVFDVQHDEAHYFTQADLDVFQTLAAQIANAFQSAAAFNLAEQERQRAQTYLNVAGSLIVALDRAGDIVLINKAGCDVLGYEEAELLGKNWFDVSLPAKIAGMVKDVFSQIIAGDIEQTEYYENEIQTRSGDMRIVAWRNSLITDEQGNITGVLSSGEDITERKRAEEEIRIFQTLAEQSTDGILMADLTTQNLIYANQAAHEQFGYDYESREMVGKDGALFWAEEELPRLESILAQAAREGWQGDVLQRRQDGSIFDASATAFVLLDADGNPTQLVIMIRDITERKHAEKVLQESEKKLSDALRIAKMANWEFDVEAQTFLFNDQYYKTFHNTTAEEVGGDEMSATTFAQNFVVPEDAPAVAKNIQMALDATDPDFQLQTESRNLTVDGEEVWASIWLTIEKDETGKTTKLYGVNQDITERKQAEAEIRTFQTLAEESTDGILMINLASQTVTYANQAVYKLFGYDYESRQMIGENGLVLWPESEIPQLRRILEQAPHGGWQGDVLQQRRDGSVFPASATAFVLFGTDDNLVVMLRDITERKQAEVEREQFTARLSIAAQISEQVGSILDPDELLNTVIPLIKEQFGLYYVHVYTLDEESGMLNLRAGYGEAGEKMLAKGHSIPLDREASLVATAARTGEVVSVGDITKNPNHMPNPLLPDTRSEVAVPSIAGGRVLGVFDVQHDEIDYFTPADLDVFQTLAAQIANAFRSAELFAGQEKLTAELKESEVRFRETVNRSLAGIYRSNPAGDMLEANPAWLEIAGFESLAALNKVGLPNLYVNLDDRARFVELTAKGPVKGFETQYRRADGTVIDVSLSSNPVFDDSGNLLILDGVLEDITARKQAEAEQARFTTRLNTAAQISEQVGSILDPDELLHTVIPLIKEQFGLYYVHVYTLDEASGLLNLRAGYGEAGEKMLAKGHSIPLDREASLVATAARTREVVLVNDVTANPNFMPNPLLPDTKTEVAVPSIAGGKVLGVFDVQHDEAHYFTQADLDVFQTLAAQIANAFRSAELFEQSESQRALYDGILTNLPTAVFAVDSKFDLLVTNEAAQKLLGRQMTDKEGNVYTEQYDVVYYDTGERFPEGELPLVKANTLGGQHATNEMAVRHPGGELVPLLVNAGPLVDPAGEQMGAVVTFTDMTAQRKAQEEVERYLDQTEMRLRVSQALAGAETEEDVLNVMVEQAALYSHVQITVNLLDPAAAIPTFVLDRTVGFDTTLTSFMPLGTRIPADRFPMLKLIADNEVFISPNAMEDPRVDEVSRKTLQRSGSVSLAIIPVLAGRELLGIFVLFSEEEDYFDEHKMFLYQMLVEQSADAILAARLRGQLNLTRFSVDRGPAAIYWLRPDASIYDVNDTACQLLGYTRDELLSIERFTDLDPNFPPDAWAAHWEDLKEQQRITIQTQHRSKDGHIIPVEVEVNYIQYGDLEFNCAFARDITERLEAERAVQESQRLLQEFLDNFPDLAFAKDLEGRIILANKALYASFPTSDGKLMGKTVHDLVPEEIADGIWQSELKILEDGEVVELEEVVPQEDEIHTKLTTKFPLYDTEGNVTALGGVSIDITERKRAEMELARFAGRLDTASEIARQVGSILDPDELLHTVIPLIKEQFGLYYVHVYTLDEESGMLNLRAGYGEAGAQMLAKGHRIPLDREASLVATAARTREPVLVDDVTENPNFMPNPLLPDTKTEVAVPSIAGGKVLGVFDVQHDEAHYFTQADLDVFQTLAAQIANAFRSAELLIASAEAQVKFQTVADYTYDWEYWLGPDGEFIYVSPACEKVTGYTVEEFTRNPQLLDEILYPGDVDVLHHHTQAYHEDPEQVESAKQVAEVEFRIVTKDGRERWIAHACQPVYGAQGEWLGRRASNRDITESKQAEVAIRANEERLSLALKAGRVGIWEFLPQKDKTYFNATWYTMLGYEPDELPQSLETWSALLHPDDREAASATINAGIAAGEDFELQFRMKTKDNKWRWIQAHGYITERTPDGATERTIGTHTDITEQHLAQEALEASNEQQRTILATVPVGIAITRVPDGEVLYVNSEFSDILGYTAEDVLNQAAPNFYYYEEDAVKARDLMLAQEGVLENHEIYAKKADGTPLWLSLSIRPLMYGGQSVSLTAFTDITERKQAAAAVAESQQMLQAVMDNLPESIFWKDTETLSYMGANTRFAQDAGLEKPADLIGKTDFDMPWGDRGDAYRADDAAVIESGVAKLNYEEPQSRPGGTSWLRTSKVPLYDAEGNIYAVLGAYADITAEKQAQAERERFAVRLNTAAQISEQVGSILDPDELLHTVIPLIKEQFGLYYVHVYTLDEEFDMLNLRAGYGEAGAQMLAQGHSIPLDREASLVATAARTREVVLVDDVTANPNYMPNPLLPDTKAEVAVPAIAGGKVLGVFDVQHDEAYYFTPADIDVFQTLAAQIANALRSAELFNQAESQRALYDGILTNLPTAVFAVDSKFDLLVTNEAAQKLLGRQMTDKEGNVYTEQYDVVYYDTGERFPEGELPLVKANTLGGQHATNEMAVRHPGGELVPLLVNAGPLVNPSGEQMGSVVTFTDMTAQRKAQEEVERYLEQTEIRLQISQTLADAQTEEAVLDAMVEQSALYPNVRITINLLDTESDTPTFTLERSVEFDSEVQSFMPVGTRIPADHFPMLQLIESGDAFITSNAIDDPRVDDASGQVLQRSGAVSLAVLPITSGRELMGIFVLLSEEEDYFDERKMFLYQTLVDESADAIQSARLRDRLQLVMASVDQSLDSYFWFDTDARFTAVTERTCEILGYERDELLGMTIFDIDPGFPPEAWPGLKAQVKEEGSATVESFHRTKDGRTFPVEITVSSLEFGEQETYFSIARDITERKAAEVERERLTSVIESSTDLVTIGDADGQLMYWNQAAAERLGIPAGTEPMAYNVVQLVAQHDIERVSNHIIPTIIQEGRFSAEVTLCSLSGENIPVLAAFFAKKDDEGNVLYMANVSRDISDLKAAEAERERFINQLGTSAEISTQINTILDPDALLEFVVPLVKERFNLYHVHFYELDMEAEELVMKAGYGKVGEIMRQQGHKIALDRERSLVAKAARSKDVVVVNDVQEEEGYLPNMLLPNTRAEVALPAMVSGHVLGVLDVQADQPDYFTSSDLDVFRTMVSQIATALQNAHSFEQQRVAEAEVRKSAETIRAIFDAITDGITVTNMMGEITDLNQASLELFEHTKRDDLLGHNTMELVAPEQRSKVAESFSQALETGSSGLQEFPLLRKDGAVFAGELTAALLRDEFGNPMGFINVSRDITERKEAEEAVQASEERYRALIDNMQDGVFLIQDGKMRLANQAFADITGYTVDEIIGMDFTELIAPEDLAEVAENYRKRQAGEPVAPSYEWRMLHKDGHRVYVSMSVGTVKLEGKVASLGTVKDITERMRAEQERQRFTTQLQTASDVAAQINTILEPEKLLSTVVPQIKDRFDLYHVHVYTLDQETEELVMRFGSGEPGRIMREEGHKIPLQEENSLVAQATRTREPVVVNDVTQDPNFMPNPLLPDTRAEVAVPITAGDQVLGVVDVQDDEPGRFTTSDINVFTTLSAQIAAALQNAQLFNEIQLTADRLREVDRLKSEFLANMSHELRTPMNSILGYTEVLLMGIDGDLDPEMLQDVEAIYENGQHLLRLINDVLDLAKIEAGRMSLTMEDVYVDLLLDEVKTSNIGLLHKRQTPVELVVDAEEDLPIIQADRIRLSQILNNLVSNAVKFTEKGYIWLRAYQDDSWMCIEVEDTGIGISEEDMGKLFERFQQVDGSTTRRAEGTGLGLSITRHLVEMHGGEIEVFSDVGKGSKFLIRLPIPDSDSEVVIE